MSSHNDAASTYSSTSYSSSVPLVKGAEKKPSKTQAARQWAKELVDDLGRSPSYRYDTEHGTGASSTDIPKYALSNAFNNRPPKV